jgi:hypothetical protein
MTRTILTVVTLLVGCATGAVVREVVAPARAQGQAGPNYEYDVVWAKNAPDFNTAQQALTRHGQQGWRLVAVSVPGNFFFERQLPAH